MCGFVTFSVVNGASLCVYRTLTVGYRYESGQTCQLPPRFASFMEQVAVAKYLADTLVDDISFITSLLLVIGDLPQLPGVHAPLCANRVRPRVFRRL